MHWLENGIIGERERANLIVQRARFLCIIFIIIIIYTFPRRCHAANRPRVSKFNATHDISQKFTTVCTGTVIVFAVVQLLQSKMRQNGRAVSLLLRARKPIETVGENTCSQERASCLGNSRGERGGRCRG